MLQLGHGWMVLGPEGVNRRWRLTFDVRKRPVGILHRIGSDWHHFADEHIGRFLVEIRFVAVPYGKNTQPHAAENPYRWA